VAADGTGPMRVSVRIPPCAPVGELAAVAARCEELGYSGVWFPDSQLLWRDPYVAAAMALGRTADLDVGIAVSNAVTRHPSVVAGLRRTLAEQGPHRFVLGMGAGHSATAMLGLPPATNPQLRTALDVMRQLGAGGTWDFGAGPVRQEAASDAGRVYVAASGPRNLATAAEHADGVILLAGADPGTLDRALAAIGTGSARRAPQRAPLTRVLTAFCLPTDHPERDARLLKPICVAMARHLGAAGALRAAGITVGEQPLAHPVYPDLIHAADWPAAVLAVDHLVSDEDAATFARRFCLFGRPAEIAARIAELGACGVDEVLLQHLGSFDLPHEWLETCAVLAGQSSQ
jgi:5,10-methylenetetrahydromethanopterin reductase